MLRAVYETIRAAALGYARDACLSRSAAIAYYTMFALAPMLVIVSGAAGLVFGEAEAQDAILAQIRGLMGSGGADTIEAMIRGVSHTRSGLLATLIGAGTLLIVATGVFAEVQTALNTIWKVRRRSWTPLELVRVRLQGLVLMLIMGLLLLLSLVATTAITLAGGWLEAQLPGVPVPLHELNFVISFVLIAMMFAAIYKVLPDTYIAWRDVGIGAVVTAALFTAGKFLIGLYVAHSFFVTSYGVAGTFAVVLLWFHYSSLIFLFGAELTFAYAEQRGSRAGQAHAYTAAGHVADLRLRLERENLRRHAPRRRGPRAGRSGSGPNVGQ
jgi:membrane protein